MIYLVANLNLILLVTNSKDKSKESDTKVVAKSSDVQKSITEIAEANYTRLIDLIIKIQPHYTQAISNLQSDYIKSIKRIIEASFVTQEYLLFTKLFNWNNTPFATIYIQQSDSLTNNIVRSLHTATQLGINTLEAAGNSLETCSNVVKAVTEVNSNLVTCWNSFFPMQQQHF
ncbi:MAG TPA: hypothetical protein VEH06_18165 [Candidatus Bathyarchaeia archaeon]|nr:hypothetical protein [Candidatus Bathyarchaeia archaeon]